LKPIIVLDSGPLGLLMQRRGLPVADACRAWLVNHIQNGAIVLVPEIADYEVRRELIRIKSTSAIKRLNAFNNAVQGRYLAITTNAMRQAADFWAQSRQQGLPTADPKELDGDVIVAAQVITSGSPITDIVVATTNPVHLKRFVPADLWTHL
jgi:hypothetical protein